MSFKTRQIRQKPRPQPLKKLKQMGTSVHDGVRKLPSRTLSYVVSTILVFFGMFVVFKVTMGAYHLVSNFTPADLISTVSSDLKTDENGYTNILLLGDGGYKRDGAGLMDSIMVASIDYKKNIVSMLSVPRDYYITKANNLGLEQYGRINEIYINHSELGEEEGFHVFKDAVGQLVNLDIQYYMRVDFKGFVEIVDSLGGITVDVPDTIYDSTYPNATDTGYAPFSIQAGLQELDGETALKYARTRHSGAGDYDRSARQQLILEAIQQKALSSEVLMSVTALTDLYDAVSDNFNTDMSIREMAALGEYAQKMDRARIVRKQLHTDTSSDGGFLYDGVRALYGGAAVVLPEGDNLELIHEYTDLVFNHREIYFEPAKLEVLNATKLSGIATGLAYDLKRFGFIIENVGNNLNEAGEKELSPISNVIYHDWTEQKNGLIKPKFQSTLEVLENFVIAQPETSKHSFPVLQEDEEAEDKVYEGNGVNISIVLGDNYKEFLRK